MYQRSDLKYEIIRKIIHISSSAIPIGYYFLDKKLVLQIVLPILLALLLIELFKYKVNFIYGIYIKLFKSLLREHEFDRSKFRINGASWVLIGDTICIFLFPKFIAITGMLLLSLADSISAFTGKIFAKKYYAPNRSYLGSITFLLVGIIIILLSPKYFHKPIEYIIGIIAVFVTTIADSISLPADDNLLIPVISCVVLYVLYLLFFPPILV